MFGKRTFGKLGNRASARLEIDIEGGLRTPTQSYAFRLENASVSGCGFAMDGSDRDRPLHVGTEVLVKFERVETFGQIAWIARGRCGVKFVKPIKQEQLARLRWIVEHPERHQRNAANAATAMWR